MKNIRVLLHFIVVGSLKLVNFYPIIGKCVQSSFVISKIKVIVKVYDDQNLLLKQLKLLSCFLY